MSSTDDDGSTITCRLKEFIPQRQVVIEVSIVLSCVSLVICIITFIVSREEKKRRDMTPKHSIRSPRRFMLGSSFSGFSVSAFAVVTAILGKAQDNDIIQKPMAFVMVGWISSATLYVGFKVVLFHHALWMIDLPNRTGDVDVLVTNALSELEGRKTFGTRFIALLFSMSFGVGMSVATVTAATGSYSAFCSFLRFIFFVFLGLKLALVYHAVVMMITLRRHDSMPLLVSRLLVCALVSTVSLLWTLAFYVTFMTNDKSVALVSKCYTNCPHGLNGDYAGRNDRCRLSFFYNQVRK
jgi:hypothetical protein